MSTLTAIGFTATAAALAVALASGVTQSHSSSPKPARQVVVAELFTSEGCSSCPPADALLQQITSMSPVAGIEVIGLEEHVDYWDRLGWRDPFSSAAFTARQSAYDARVFRSGQIYTPQLVVDGAFEVVGSDASRVRKAIAAAGERPAAKVLVSAMERGNRVHVDAVIDGATDIHRAGAADIVLAIVESGVVSLVERGENRGRVLPHAAVVRSLNAIGVLPPDLSARTLSSDLPLAPGWQAAALRVVVFIQERDGFQILGAGAAPITS